MRIRANTIIASNYVYVVYCLQINRSRYESFTLYIIITKVRMKYFDKNLFQVDICRLYRYDFNRGINAIIIDYRISGNRPYVMYV